jgi:phosphoribosylaminoimidazole-succinocarboxamide synthase
MSAAAGDVLFESNIPGLELLGRGKVRDIYAIDDEHLLIVTTDRLSAFDVILPDPIPGKGGVLTRVSSFWFHRLADLIPHHLTGRSVEEVLPAAVDPAPLFGRSIVARRLRPLPVEAVVRGYLAGSGWKDYLATGRVCGHHLPPGLQPGARLPEPLFTPATKAEAGAHDENIDFAALCTVIGEKRAGEVRDTALALYAEAARHAESRGIIVADTKFEFGLDSDDRLVWIDEALTPDSSRFWPAEAWQPGQVPPSFDKQYVRDYLETLDWNKRAPGPRLPPEVIAQTAARYREAEEKLCG